MHKKWILITLVIASLFFNGVAFAEGETEENKFDPNRAEYYTPEFKAVAEQLKAMDSCTSLYACPSGPLARTAKDDIVTMIQDGKSKDEILDYFVDIYGEEILITPKKEGFGLLAYVVPFALLGVATAGIYFTVGRWVKTNKSQVQTEEVIEDETESEIIRKMIDDERKKFL